MAGVEDDYAGMTVQCPKCGGNIAVPVAGAARRTATHIVAARAKPAQRPTGGDFIANLTPQTKLLLLIGLGCLGLLVLLTLFPWISRVDALVPLEPDAPREARHTELGVTRLDGILQLLLSAGAAAFVINAIVNKHDLHYHVSLWSALGWGAL